LIVTLCYAGWCAVSPFGPCVRCFGEAGHACPECDGAGRRPRIGRRIYHAVRREYRSGNRGRDYDDFRD
jgi:hypothetical protein